MIIVKQKNTFYCDCKSKILKNGIDVTKVSIEFIYTLLYTTYKTSDKTSHQRYTSSSIVLVSNSTTDRKRKIEFAPLSRLKELKKVKSI